MHRTINEKDLRFCVTTLEHGVRELVKARVDDGAVKDVGILKGRHHFVAPCGMLDVRPQRVRGGSGHTLPAVVRSIGGSVVSKTLANSSGVLGDCGTSLSAASIWAWTTMPT